MKRALALGFVGILMVCAPGCGNSEADNAIKQTIDDMNALSDAVEKNEPADKIKAIAERMKANVEKSKGIKVTKSEDERLKKKYEKPLADAKARYQAAAMKNPEGAMAAAAALAGFAP
jgi:hypothetical protein